MIKKIFRQMLLAQILSSMTVMICMLIDNIVIGRNLGIHAMTAYELASPVLLVFAAIGTTLSAGIQVQCGKTMQLSDRKASNECFSTAIVSALTIAGIGLFFVMVFIDPLCRLLMLRADNPSEQLFQMTKNYLQGFIIGAPAFILAQISVPFLQMSGNRKLLVIAVGSMTFADIVFDILNVTLIDGGMFGMGMASSASYYVALAIGLVAFCSKKFIFKFKIKCVRFKLTRKLLRYGLPTVISQISLVFLTYIINQILWEGSGADADFGVAAYSVISTVGNICFSVGSGIGAVAMMLASICYSEEDRTSMKQLIKTMCWYAVLLNFILTVIISSAAWPIAKLFLAEQKNVNIDSAVDITTRGLRLYSLCLIPAALNAAFRHFYQGVNRRGMTNTISVLQNFVLTALFAFVFNVTIGMNGVWLAFVCGETATFIVMSVIVRVRSGKRLSTDAYIMMRDDFGVTPENCFEASATDQEGVEDAIGKAKEFCLAHDLTEDETEHVAFCMKELAGNIISYGFSADTKVHSIDFRLWIKDGKKFLRVRDNCVEFDPVRYRETHRFERSKSHAGIRQVMERVHDARYVNSLGLNNLTLELK